MAAPDQPHLVKYSRAFASAIAHWPPCIPCIQDPRKGFEPALNAVKRPPAFPFGDAFPNGEISPPPACSNRNLFGEDSLFSGELALPVSGGSRQPLDRQVRYYSERAQLASRDLILLLYEIAPVFGKEHIRPKKPKRHSPKEWRLDFCAGHWPLGMLAGG